MKPQEPKEQVWKRERLCSTTHSRVAEAKRAHGHPPSMHLRARARVWAHSHPCVGIWPCAVPILHFESFLGGFEGILRSFLQRNFLERFLGFQLRDFREFNFAVKLSRLKIVLLSRTIYSSLSLDSLFTHCCFFQDSAITMFVELGCVNVVAIMILG